MVRIGGGLVGLVALLAVFLYIFLATYSLVYLEIKVRIYE